MHIFGTCDDFNYCKLIARNNDNNICVTVEWLQPRGLSVYRLQAGNDKACRFSVFFGTPRDLRPSTTHPLQHNVRSGHQKLVNSTSARSRNA